MRANMQTLEAKLATIKAALTAIEAVTVTESDYDENVLFVRVNLGSGWRGEYKGGYWGDCAITNDELEMHFTVGDVWGEGEEITCGEGFVHLNYKGGVQANGLAYTGELDKLVCEKIASATNNIVEATSSEQGMQGHYDEDESYLSLDVFV